MSWSRSDMRKERLEIVSPFGGDANASSAIVSVCGRLLVFTAMNHRHPNAKLSRTSFSVRPSYRRNRCPLDASAAGGVAATQIAASDDGCVATVTEAFPDSAAIRVGISHDQQFAESLSGNIVGKLISHTLASARY